MTRESFKRRLEALEEASKLDAGSLEVRHINFVGRDGLPVDATVARGPGDFVCHRAVGEELAEFRLHASNECIASKPRVPVAILVFTKEVPDAAA
jgi:hypothetical protein